MRTFDTAPLYGLGLSEARIGRNLAAPARAATTSCPQRSVGCSSLADRAKSNAGIYVDAPQLRYVYDYSYDGVMRSFEASLKRLGLDSVDILFVHDVDGANHGGRAGSEKRIQELMRTGGWRALDELRASGAVAAIGAGVNEWEPCARLLELADPDLFLLAGRYTLLEQAPLDTLFPQCEERGVGIVLGGPYNSGVLAGRATFDYGEIPRKRRRTRSRSRPRLPRARSGPARGRAAIRSRPPARRQRHSGCGEHRGSGAERGAGRGEDPGIAVVRAQDRRPASSRGAGARMIRIDSHHHLWRIDRGDYAWLTKEDFPAICRDFLPADIVPLLKQCDVDKTVLVQAAESVAETEFLLGIAREAPFVAGVVGWARSLRAQRARRDRAPGAGQETRRPPADAAEPAGRRMDPAAGSALAIAALKSARLRFDVLIFPRHLPVAAKFFARHPDLPMVIDHGAKPYIARGEIEPWQSQMADIARDFPNVFCKLSGLATEAAPGWTVETLRPYVGALIEAFGPQRLMWGSDWPVLTLAGSYPGWFGIASALTDQLSGQDRDEIFGGTAARFSDSDTTDGKAWQAALAPSFLEWWYYNNHCGHNGRYI